MEKMLVTGGAGFIGSRLTDALIIRRINICVFDNLTAGTLQNIKPWLKDPNFNFIKGDLLNSANLTKIEKTRFELVFHLAANPEVRVGLTNRDIHFQQNIVATHNLLESIRKTKNNTRRRPRKNLQMDRNQSKTRHKPRSNPLSETHTKTPSLGSIYLHEGYL